MALATIRTQIQSMLLAADPGSKVYAYRRWIVQPELFIKELQPLEDGPVRAWMFWLESIAESLDTYTQSSQAYVFGVRFYHSVRDADQSELVVQDLIQTVRAAFRAAPDLNGAAFSIVPTAGPMARSFGLQLDSLEFVQLGGVFCHQAALRLGVQELLAL